MEKSACATGGMFGIRVKTGHKAYSGKLSEKGFAVSKYDTIVFTALTRPVFVT